MLHIRQIKKFYGSFEVLNIPEIKLSKGKYWLKGNNGSGKSTFLNILAGLLPFNGDLSINDFSINKNPVEYRRLVNHAPAEPVYPSFVSGQSLVDFYTAIKKPLEKDVETIKSVLGIDDYLSNPTGSYSSGMLKKLSLLLAFIGEPQLILLDEPFTTLDTESQTALQKLIKERNDTGFILTSHHDIAIDEIEFDKIFTINYKTLEVHQ